MKKSVVIFIVLVLTACIREKRQDVTDCCTQSLDSIFSNSSTIIADSIKYCAAKFLIENMPVHFYLAEQQELYNVVDSLNFLYRSTPREVFDEYREKYDSCFTTISVSKANIYKDVETLSSDFLINHIDNVFVVFDRSPWRKYLSFNDFCEYLLPYCISDEKRESWIPAYREVYEPLITEAFKEYERRDTTLSSIFNFIRSELERRDIARIYPDYQWLNHYSPTTLLNVRWGSCNNFAVFLTFLLRSAGIPATIDSAPQWGAYSSGIRGT